jgi:hypothetical protein
MHDMRYLYRFRSDRSWPALSNCSIDMDPGSGLPAEGDSVGTINGFVEWDTTIVDSPREWSATLWLRDLPTRWGVLEAPDECTVDVTPRRLQKLEIVDGITYQWTVRTLRGNRMLQKGEVMPDGQHLLTLPGVKIDRDGVIVTVTIEGKAARGSTEWDPVGLAPPPLEIEPEGTGTFAITWAADGHGAVDLLDISGRRLRRIEDGIVRAGRARYAVSLDGLPSGIYFLSARQGEATVATRRIAVVR